MEAAVSFCVGLHLGPEKKQQHGWQLATVSILNHFHQLDMHHYITGITAVQVTLVFDTVTRFTT